MNGNIWLTKDIMNKSISAVNKLRKGIDVNKSEAEGIGTLWHEITHNRNKIGNMEMTRLETRFVELANEFIARNTLHEFYGAFGSAVQHPEFITNRTNTSYNEMVRNYQLVIEKTGLDKQKDVDKVKKYLFNE